LRKIIENKEGFAGLVPLALAIIIGFALLFIGGYVNGMIHNELYQASTSTDNHVTTMKNISYNYDSVLDIVQVTIIITVLAAAIGAIFLFTRFRA